MKHEILNTKNIHSDFLTINSHTIKVIYDDNYSHIIDRYLVDGSNAASVFVYDKKNNLSLMVEQFRVGMINEKDASSLECPAGLIDLNETAAEAIIRELKEETGLIISEDMLCPVSNASYLSVGSSNQRISIFTCECDLSNVKENVFSHDKDEYILTKLVPYSLLISRLKANEIKHVSQIVAIQHSILKDICF